MIVVVVAVAAGKTLFLAGSRLVYDFCRLTTFSTATTFGCIRQNIRADILEKLDIRIVVICSSSRVVAVLVAAAVLIERTAASSHLLPMSCKLANGCYDLADVRQVEGPIANHSA